MKKLIYLFMLALIVCGCTKRQPIDNYKGAIIKSKSKFGERCTELIQIKDSISGYKLEKISICWTDYDRYQVGDTIK